MHNAHCTCKTLSSTIKCTSIKVSVQEPHRAYAEPFFFSIRIDIEKHNFVVSVHTRTVLRIRRLHEFGPMHVRHTTYHARTEKYTICGVVVVVLDIRLLGMRVLMSRWVHRRIALQIQAATTTATTTVKRKTNIHQTKRISNDSNGRICVNIFFSSSCIALHFVIYRL